jgi:sugar phosphate isomerase/epimerase
MRIGVSSYSFVRLVRSGALAEVDIPAKAKAMGFDVVEFSAFNPPSGVSPEEHADRLRAAAEVAGIPIANYTIGADFLNGSNGDLAAEIARVRGEVDIARRLGAPGMRHDATRGFPADHKGPRSFDAALPRLVEGCRAVTEYAAGFGIRTMVENHGFFCQDSERVEKLVCAVAHPNFGTLVDMGNFICADENPATAVGRVMPYAFHCHAKDFHLKPGTQPFPGEGWNLSRGGGFWRGAIIGHGDVPVLQCLRAMRRAGYDGVLSIEFEGLEDPLQGIALGQKNLRRLLDLAG